MIPFLHDMLFDKTTFEAVMWWPAIFVSFCLIAKALWIGIKAIP